MQVVAAPNYPYPTMFLIGGRAASGGYPPVEPVGVLVVKQTLPATGPSPAQEKILMSDVAYPPGDSGRLGIHFEADLASGKPSLDVVVVRDDSSPGNFGTMRIDRGAGFGGPRTLPFGWRDRTAPPRALEGGDAASFVPPAITDPAHPPPLVERLKLPNGFRNEFFLGGRLSGEPALRAGDVLEFNGQGTRQMRAPRAPRVRFTAGAEPIPRPAGTKVEMDTVVLDVTADRFLTVWRCVFPWTDALSHAQLEVD